MGKRGKFHTFSQITRSLLLCCCSPFDWIAVLQCRAISSPLYLYLILFVSVSCSVEALCQIECWRNHIKFCSYLLPNCSLNRVGVSAPLLIVPSSPSHLLFSVVVTLILYRVTVVVYFDIFQYSAHG